LARWNNWSDSEIEKAFQEVGIIEAKRISGSDLAKKS